MIVDWERASKYLDEMIEAYRDIGWAGVFGLNLVLLPLKRRLELGERTEELYERIMECE